MTAPPARPGPRTLWLTNDLPPRAGGIEQFLHNLLLRLDPQDAVVVGPAHPDALDHDRAAPYRVVRAAGSVQPTPAVRDLVRVVARDHRPDVVVLGATWPLGELAGRLRADLGVPVVGITHGLEAGLATARLGRLVRRATRDLDAATVISGFTRRELGDHLAAPRVAHVPPGVDLELFHPGVDGAAVRAGWGVPPDAPLVGCISRLVPRKGQDQLLDAWPRLAELHPEAWLVLAGTGPLEAALRRRAAHLERVVVPGRVPWADLPGAYAALDLFVMPCRTRRAGTDVEGLGIVFLEAQACGVPVVAGDSGGAPETVAPGTGTVVDGTDVAELCDAVHRWLADPAARAAAGRAGRAHVEARWGWDGIAERMRSLLTEVVAAGGAGGRPDPA
ncbi:MAG: glycosyltransferase family 4 protein [Actinomycetes bacterium]